jgi:hypothetical protein
MAVIDTSVAQPPQVEARPSRSTLVRLAQIAACVGIPAIVLFAPWDIPVIMKAEMARPAFVLSIRPSPSSSVVRQYANAFFTAGQSVVARSTSPLARVQSATAEMNSGVVSAW